MNRQNFRILDIFFLFLSIGAIVGAVFWSAAGSDGVLWAKIEASGEIWEMPLDRDNELVVTGPIGETRIIVEDGTVRVVDSDCRDKICVAMGRIEKPSAWIACLPNRVFISIVGRRSEEDVDAGAF